MSVIFLLASVVDEKVAPFGLYFFLLCHGFFFTIMLFFYFHVRKKGSKFFRLKYRQNFEGVIGKGKRGRALGINELIIKREMSISFLSWVCISLIAALNSYGNHQTSLFNSQFAVELVYGPCWTHTTSPRRPSLISSGQLIFVYIYTQGIPIPY